MNFLRIQESGYLKPNGNEDPIQVAQGNYQYYSPEGELIQVQYLAVSQFPLIFVHKFPNFLECRTL